MIKIILAILNIYLIQYVFVSFMPSEGLILGMDPATMLIISGITKGASALFSLGQAATAKKDMRIANANAKKYVNKAYDSASINAQRMRSIDPSLYDTASENISQDLSTVLDVTAGDDPRLAAAMGSRLAQQSTKQRQALEMQKRTDIQNLDKDIAKGEQEVAGRIQALDESQAIGFQQQAADAQQRMTQGTQAALQAPASLVGDYTGMVTAGVSPMQIKQGLQPKGYSDYLSGSDDYFNLPEGLSTTEFKNFMRQQ